MAKKEKMKKNRISNPAAMAASHYGESCRSGNEPWLGSTGLRLAFTVVVQLHVLPYVCTKPQTAPAPPHHGRLKTSKSRASATQSPWMPKHPSIFLDAPKPVVLLSGSPTSVDRVVEFVGRHSFRKGIIGHAKNLERHTCPKERRLLVFLFSLGCSCSRFVEEGVVGPWFNRSLRLAPMISGAEYVGVGAELHVEALAERRRRAARLGTRGCRPQQSSYVL